MTDAPLSWPERRRGDSPCINICQIHPSARICVGCHRTMDEIASWGRLSGEERRAILDALPARASRLVRRRGGRGGRVPD